jgi:hypothetical protein
VRIEPSPRALAWRNAAVLLARVRTVFVLVLALAAVLLAIALALALAIGATAARAGAEEPPSILLLPVGGARVLEERVLIALGDRGRARPFALRDIPEAARGELPADPAACLGEDCVRRLARAASAGRVLSLELLGDSLRPSLFATLYDGRSGRPLQRRELGAIDPYAPPPSLPAAIAAWVYGDPPPSPRPIARPSPRPLVALELAPPSTPAGEALLAGVAEVLGAYPSFATIRDGASDPPPTWRARLTVDSASVITRPHHLHRYRDAQLTATLVIGEAATGRVVFTHHAQAESSEHAHHSSDAGAMAALERRVLAELAAALDAQAVPQRLARRTP